MEGRVTDALRGEIGGCGGSECHHFKRKKLKKKLFFGLQRGTWRHQGASRCTDASQREMSRSTKPCQVKDGDDCASTMHEGVCRFCNCRCKVYGGIDSSGKKTAPLRPVRNIGRELAEYQRLNNVKLSLEFYKKNHQDVEYEFVEILHYEYKKLNVYGLPAESMKEWLHLSFTALPKNADRRVVAPTHFFAELAAEVYASPYEVKYCTTFERRDDPGFEHGCMICPADTRFHPGNDLYTVGRHPYYAVKILWR